MQIIFDAARTAVTIFFLFYASWSDYKTREVSNRVWVLFAPSAFTLTLVELLFYGDGGLIFYGICFGLTATIAVILFYTGGFGGADAKALMCLALALPFYPRNLFMPLSGDVSPISQILFPLTVLSNSVFLAAMTAVYMLFRNIFWHLKTGQKLFEREHQSEAFAKKILVLITGYKIPIDKLKEKWHLYPLEDVENAEDKLKRRLIVVPKDKDRD